MSTEKNGAPLKLCPSSRPEIEGSYIFAVVGGTVDKPLMKYLEKPKKVTPELLKMCEPVHPTEVFRFASQCAGSKCGHFDGSECQLVKRTVNLVQISTPKLPRCLIRPECKWYGQEGRAACMRCPSVVTDNYAPSEMHREAAGRTVVLMSNNTARLEGR